MHHKWLETDIDSFLKNEDLNLIDYQSVMKQIIRCGFELVLLKALKYTLDLYPAVQSFAKFYPTFSREMHKVLYYFLNPGKNSYKQRKLVLTFGNWLVKEINTALK